MQNIEQAIEKQIHESIDTFFVSLKFFENNEALIKSNIKNIYNLFNKITYFIEKASEVNINICSKKSKEINDTFENLIFHINKTNVKSKFCIIT